jgi:hypothetical protein
LRDFTDDRSYVEKVRPGADLFYSTLIESGPLPGALRRQLQCSHAPSLQQSLLWFGDEYVLSALPIILSTHKNEFRSVELSEPLSTDHLINFLVLLSSIDQADFLAKQAADNLVANGILARSDIEATWPLLGNFGIQIWNLDGTAGRDTSELYKGAAESIEYAWEISALLSYNSDHLLERGLWLRRSPQQVYNQVRAGFGFFEDHMVFLNADCCLEMSHLPAWLRSSSEFRLSSYGYDSSSLFIWTVGMLQEAIIEDLSNRYRNLIAQFIDRDGMKAVEHASIAQMQIRHTGLIDRLSSFRGFLVEARNRAFDESRALERSSDRSVILLRREIEKTGTLADGLLRVQEEAAQFRRDSVLATIGVALGASQIPGFVSQTETWIRTSNWLPLIISDSLIIVALSLMPFIWGRRRRS